MSYTVGYFGGSGPRSVNPLANDTPSTKRRRLNELADAASIISPEAGAVLHELGDLYGPNTEDQVVPNLITAPSQSRAQRSNASLAARSRIRRSRKRMPRRSRWSFNKKVERVLLNLVETKEYDELYDADPFQAGDGTSAVLYINNPVSQIGQGSEGQDLEGNEIYLRGISWNGRWTNNETHDCYVYMWCIWTPQFADLPVGFSLYGSTTTTDTFPTQVPPEANIIQFDSAAANGQFVGSTGGFRDTFDTDLVKVVWLRKYHLRHQHNPTQIFKHWIPINRMWKHTTISGVTPADQLRNIRSGNYYLCIKVVPDSATNDIAATATVTGDGQIKVYFKDP